MGRITDQQNIQTQGRVGTGRISSQPTQTRTTTGKGRITGTGVIPQAKTSGSKTPNLRTAEGLQQTAEQFGVDTSNLPVQGESPGQIFSGGFVSDVFDTLNALQHGVVGVVKGDGFVDGVKNRASFTDKDLLGDKGTGGFIAGIALDIAFDPLTYIAPVTAFRKLGILGTVKGGARFLGKTPIPSLVTKSKAGQKLRIQNTVGDQLGTMFVYRYGQDPVYKKLANRAILNKEKAVQSVIDVVRPVAKLNSQAQQAIAAARKSGNLGRLSPNLYETARPAFEELDRLGREAVDNGLLKKEIYDENVGKYLPRLYRKYEDPARALKQDEVAREFFDSKVMSQTADRFRRRTDIPEEIRDAMGEVLEAAYPTAKGMMQMTRAVENAKFFKEVDRLYATADDLPGFAKLPKTDRLGVLSGKNVPKFIADDINEIIRTTTAVEDISKPIVGTFKFSKVILNPATHARNVMSNLILNSFEGMPPGHPAYFRAAREVATKGKIYKEAQQFGLGIDTFAAAEIGEFLKTKQVRKLSQPVQKSLKKIADVYQKEEEFAKMAQYIFQTRTKGLNPEEAWKIAERATFNYAQVTPFIRHMRTAIYGMPFITFTAKATPQVARTIVQHPQRIAVYGKIKNAIENLSDEEELERERASEPPWVRDGYYVKLPGKDELGRSKYLDLTYIIPFGDLIGGNIFQRDVQRDTGFQESFLKSTADQSFGFNVARELVNNQDFFGNKIYRESDSGEKQAADIGRYLFQTFAPPLIADVVPGGFRESGERRPTPFERVKQVSEGNIEAGGRQTRTVGQEFLSRVGIKLNPVDVDLQETFSEIQRARGLETLLKEQGIIRSFDINFIPDVNR